MQRKTKKELAMQNKEDLRVKRTKQALNIAFTSLIEEKFFEDISINELCQKAGIRRATFYKHFKDKNDFLREYIGFLRQKYEAENGKQPKTLTSVQYYVDYAREVIEFVYENDKIVENAIRSNMLHTIIGIITEKNFLDTCGKLNESVKSGMKLPASVETISAMLTGGVATIICLWIFEGKKKGPSELAAELETLIKNVLSV